VFAENHASSADSPAPSAAKPRRSRRNASAKPKASGRSRLTNNPFGIRNVNSGSTWLRRARDVVGILVSDRGGPDMVSGGTELVIRRIATLTVTLERIEEKWIGQWDRGEVVEAAEIDLYQRTSGTLARHLERIGMERVPRDVTPSPEAYLAHLASERARKAATDVETADGPSDDGKRAGGPATPQREAFEAGAPA
jgi:hypothetical protein